MIHNMLSNPFDFEEIYIYYSKYSVNIHCMPCPLEIGYKMWIFCLYGKKILNENYGKLSIIHENVKYPIFRKDVEMFCELKQ